MGGVSTLSNVSLSNMNFNNVNLSSDLSIFSIFSLQELVISNIVINQVTPLVTTDIATTMFVVNSLDLLVNSKILIKGVAYTNSSLSFLKFDSLMNELTTPNLINFEDMSFSNSFYSSNRAILTLDGIFKNSNIELSYNNLSFSDIEFANTGYLMKLTHQLPNNITISNSRIKNINNANILVSTPDTQNNIISTSVVFNNVTVDNVREDSTSFILLVESGTLYVIGCQFTNIYSFRDGAVITGGASKTTTIIQDSIFQYNTAQNGGVFSVSDESSIQCTN